MQVSVKIIPVDFQFIEFMQPFQEKLPCNILAEMLHSEFKEE